MFRNVLAVEAVVPDDDFFALGADSMAAEKIIGQVHREMGVRVRLMEFFDDPTVRGLAGRITAIRSASSG
jgi:acyl carrier protein